MSDWTEVALGVAIGFAGVWALLPWLERKYPIDRPHSWVVYAAILGKPRGVYAAGMSKREARHLARHLRRYDQVIAAWVVRDETKEES